MSARSLAFTMLLAALPLYACAGSTEIEPDAGTAPAPTPNEDAGTPARAPTAAEVRTNMRDGFVAEAEWMHSYGVAALADGPDAQAAFNRLRASEAQIVAAVAPLAGDARAAQLNDLLVARANAFADLVSSISAKAAPTTGDPQAALDANAKQIGEFFLALCPTTFSTSAVADLQAANHSMAATLGASPSEAVAHFDEAQAASVRFADSVSFALGTSFARVLSPATTTRMEDALSLQLHLLFADQVFWTRAYVVDYFRNAPTQPELDRAVKATEDMTGVLSRYFGPEAAQMQAYIHADTTNAVAFVFAMQSGDPSTAQVIGAQWSVGADTLAQYLATTAGVDQAAAQRLLRASVDREQAMIEARAAQQWDAEAADYQLVFETRTDFASLFASSIIATTAR